MVFGLDVRWVLRDPIVNGIDCLDELPVHLQPKHINFLVLDRELGFVGDNLLAKVSDDS